METKAIFRVLLSCFSVMLFMNTVRASNADTINVFKIIANLDAFETARIDWDVTDANGQEYRDTLTLNPQNSSDGISTATALLLASQINGKVGSTVVRNSAEFVVASSSAIGFSLRGATTRNLIEMDKEYTSGDNSLSRLVIRPDPIEGTDRLISMGQYRVTSPSGSAISFVAGAGSTPFDVAALFATNMSTIGYLTQLDGSSVLFNSPIPGRTAFLTGGEGLDYELPGVPVPEPNSLWLMITGLLGLFSYHCYKGQLRPRPVQ